ncbi:MAG: hypothetical protein RL637_133 [Pseudomonadota bacterium]|jgi:outer membrane lipopolysaccharide assembly protein LptE/RlpB
MLKKILLSIATLSLTACGTLWKTTLPTQTALDQILLSTAADRAANFTHTQPPAVNALTLDASLGKTFIDTKTLKSEEKNPRYDELYALHAVRSHFLDAGVTLVDESNQADTIVEVSRGALSVDTNTTLVGIPAMGLPIPLAGKLDIPEIPLYKKTSNRGLAKLGINIRDAKTGKSKQHSFFSVGTANFDSWEILLFFKFIDNDLNLPKEYDSLSDK